jgi:LacI family transcriptional regulator
MTLSTTRQDPERESEFVRQLPQAAVDGALILLPVEPVSGLAALRATGIPFVVVDVQQRRRIDSLDHGHPCAGGPANSEHLLPLGHRRLGVIGWDQRVMATVERLHGVRQAFATAGSAFDGSLVRYTGSAETDAGYATACDLLDLPEPPTATFGLNDNLAFGVLRAAAHRHLQVPAQLSVVGFDDLRAAELVTPRLTTVRQPLVETGAHAAQILLDWIVDDRVPRAMHIQLPTELVVRETTCSPCP